MKIIYATKNKHKYEEAKVIIESYFKEKDKKIELLLLDPQAEDAIENGDSFFDNAVIKAKHYYSLYRVPVIADDSGLCVDALGGKPGIYSARYSLVNTKEEEMDREVLDRNNRVKLLNDLKDINNRSAHYECVSVYYDGKSIISGKGMMNGEIIHEEKGHNGFGYDSIFLLPSFNLTSAEVSSACKNTISHRFLSLLALCRTIEEEQIF